MSSQTTSPSRRRVLQAGGAAAAASVLAAPAVRASSANTIKIGYVAPASGPLALFSESDPFVLAQAKKLFANGIKVGGTTYAVEIIYKDTQSDSNRASDVASELILNDNVDMLVGASTPATTVPLADQAELNGVPCVTNDTPWQPWFFSRKGDPTKGFQWTYHYFWGLEDIIAVYTSMWSQIATNKLVGALWPNDPDGNAWSDAQHGFPPALAQKGYGLDDLGRFPLPADNFTSFITDFKNKGAEIVTGVIPPPDFANFWNQSGQQGYKPKIVTVAKATEFPEAIAGFGGRAAGLSVDTWWHPTFPFHSSLTGQSCAEIAQAYHAFSGKTWTMPLGYRYSLIEMIKDVFSRAASTDPNDVVAAIRATNLNSVVGTINFNKGPVPNVSKTPLAGGQWKQGAGGVELVVIENSLEPSIPVGGKLAPIA
ncbi:ABC transporter substrate-binding protein [Acidocella sp.]|uniref:ABC transporter substrate-binding protein n=1 Tax=Acidocella sp. TaxID=50710 RepID=UPI0026241528|nr:ABC transporter substrate-binding protein [Acidocella sp.]